MSHTQVAVQPCSAVLPGIPPRVQAVIDKILMHLGISASGLRKRRNLDRALRLVSTRVHTDVPYAVKAWLRRLADAR